MNIKSGFNKPSPVLNEIKNATAPQESQIKAKKDSSSFFTEILATTTRSLRTSSMSIVENLNQSAAAAETRVPQRSQTFLVNPNEEKVLKE